jgi:hypothetical protein
MATPVRDSKGSRTFPRYPGEYDIQVADRQPELLSCIVRTAQGTARYSVLKPVMERQIPEEFNRRYHPSPRRAAKS